MTPRIDEAEQVLRAMVGVKGPSVEGAVTARDVHRFAVACGDDDEIYTSAEAARAAGYDGIPAPALMLTSTIDWDAGPLGQLRADGSGVGREAWLPLEGLRLMGGGQDVTFHTDLLAGMGFVGVVSLDRLVRKEGAGPLLLLTLKIEYMNLDGEPLATCLETLIAR